MASKIYLMNITDPQPDQDAILEYTGALPFMTGDDEEENLACGSCKGYITKGIGTRWFWTTYITSRRLLFKCPCGAYSLIPAQIKPDTVS